MSRLDELKFELRKLTPAEWRTIKTQVDAFHQLGGNRPSCTSPEESPVADWLLIGVQRFLKRRGLAVYDNIKPEMLPRGYGAKSQAVRAHLSRLVGRKMKLPEQIAFGEGCAAALARHLSWGPNPPALTLRLLLVNIEALPAALDAMFPGYARSGVLAWIFEHQEE